MYNAQELRRIIFTALPQGRVVPEHTEDAHFYRVNDIEFGNPLYPSVTGKLQTLKDPSIANFKMNQAVDYIYRNFDKITESNLMEILDESKKEGQKIFEDAGYVGTDIHDCREKYFKEWINIGCRPSDILSFIPEVKVDKRIVSGLRAIDSFINDFHYVPVVTELLVFSHKLKTGGMLDDIGIMRWPVGKGRVLKDWYGKKWDESNVVYDVKKNKGIELSTGEKFKLALVLSDLKTSNQIKAHYYFQVSIYGKMFKLLTGIKIDACIILKVDKFNGTYKLENIEKPMTVAKYAEYIIKVDEGIKMVEEIRKDNQKKVLNL